MFGVTDVHLTFSSTRNYHHLLNVVFNRAMITLGVVGLLLTIPSTRNLLIPSMVCSTGSRSYWTLLTSPLTFPISQNSPLASPSSRQLLFPFIADSGAGDLTFSPFTSTWTEALTLPATPSRQVVPSFPAYITRLFLFCPNPFQPYL